MEIVTIYLVIFSTLRQYNMKIENKCGTFKVKGAALLILIAVRSAFIFLHFQLFLLKLKRKQIRELRKQFL